MVQACAKLGSLEMMLLAQFSQLALEDPRCQASWSVLIKRKFMLEKKLSKNAEFFALNNRLSMASLKTGTTWKRYGTILFTVSSESHQRNTQS
jgi:hypothetical protein